MDADKIIAALSTKNRVLLDPEDPLFLLVTLFREVQKETLGQLAKVVADATERSVVASTAAEAAARAKAESIVSQAGEWAGLKIREAGDLVLARIQAEVQTANDTGRAAARWASRAAWIAAVSGLGAMAAVAGVMLAVAR